MPAGRPVPPNANAAVWILILVVMCLLLLCCFEKRPRSSVGGAITNDSVTVTTCSYSCHRHYRRGVRRTSRDGVSA